MGYQTILYDVTGRVARLTLNRPERLNSFNAAMHAEVRDALGRVAGDGARVLVLTGAGRGFCAGQDLGERQEPPGGARPISASPSSATTSRWCSRSLRCRYRQLPAVNGVAAGAGASIALACDLVVAAKSAAFIQAFSKLGLVPDAGATWHLPRLVGRARALGLAMLGERLPAEQAAAWGLIWRCVDDAEFPAAVERLAANWPRRRPAAWCAPGRRCVPPRRRRLRGSSTSSATSSASSATPTTTPRVSRLSRRSAHRASRAARDAPWAGSSRTR